MIDNILAKFFANELLVFLLVLSLMLAFSEIGFRIGLRLYATKDAARKGQIGGIQGAVLGLLGLLLGFTFAMAVDRYDTRRGLVLKEANAIGTTYLRASLLPDTHQAPVKDLLGHYVDTRLTYWPLVDDPAKLAEGQKLIGDIQTQLWKHTTESAKEAPTDITATFIESLNQTIDVNAETHCRHASWDSQRRMAAAGNGGGVWLCDYQLWFWCGRRAIEIGQCVSSVAHRRRHRLDLRYLPLTRGSDPNRPTAAGRSTTVNEGQQVDHLMKTGRLAKSA